jgi:hypothetical protein
MKKFYALLAGLVVAIMCLPAHARNLAPDIANFNFTVDPSTNNVTFVNTSVIGNEPGIRRAQWIFGDGSSQWTGGLDGTQHHYQSAGTYTVCLKIIRINSTTNDSIVTSDICKTVVIESACHAGFETVASTANALGKYFIAQPSHSQNKKPVRICWTFGDNTDTCIQYATSYTGTYGVYHLYSQPGYYNVCVDILYDGGCEADNCHAVEVDSPDSCRAGFEIVTSNSSVLGKYFIAQPWHNHNKKPVRICWTYGDNKDTCIQYTTSYTGTYGAFHQYAQPGNYTVCVNILYDGGCEANNCRTIHAGELPDSCRADFERIPITSTNNLLAATFRALPWNSMNKKPTRICWSFGDNKDTCINYGQDYNGTYVVSHTYQQPGQYEICIKILYDGGCEANKCRVVPIPGEDHCSVTIFELTPSVSGLARILYAAITSLPPHPVQSICWNFGDGTDTCIIITSSTTPLLPLIVHNYPGPGVYHTCVRVVLQGGCIAESCKEIVIRINSHLCGGYMTDLLVGARTIKFRAFAIHNPNDPVLNYRWNFGDGSIATGPDVTHLYNTGGEYRVCLTILTQSGCETKICNTVRVPPSNQPALQLSPNPVVNILHALFFSGYNETVVIKIVNASGIVVRNYTRYANIGVNNWEFDLSTLLPGTYLFTIQSPNQQASAIFMKQ